MVNGVEQPDDPNEISDRSVRKAARQAAEAAYVPPFVRNYQFRKAMRDTSQATINAFKAYVAGASEDIQDYWQYEQIIRRNHPNVEAARVALGRTQGAIDTFFRNAWLLT